MRTGSLAEHRGFFIERHENGESIGWRIEPGDYAWVGIRRNMAAKQVMNLVGDAHPVWDEHITVESAVEAINLAVDHWNAQRPDSCICGVEPPSYDEIGFIGICCEHQLDPRDRPTTD